MKWHDIRKGELPNNTEDNLIRGYIIHGAYSFTPEEGIFAPFWTSDEGIRVNGDEEPLWISVRELYEELDSDD